MFMKNLEISEDGKTLIRYQKDVSGHVVIPDGVTKIESFAFLGCIGLTSIDIPDSVTDLGWYTFEECSSLTSIKIPKGVTEIGKRLFAGCESLTVIGNFEPAIFGK